MFSRLPSDCMGHSAFLKKLDICTIRWHINVLLLVPPVRNSVYLLTFPELPFREYKVATSLAMLFADV